MSTDKSALSKGFDDMCSIFLEVLKMKNGGCEPSALAEKRKETLMLFVLIKKLNREEKYGLRTGREELLQKKSECNRLQQNLQNLLYEVGYLRREIRRCLQFKSQDEDIDLLPESEYAVVKQEPMQANTKHEKRLLRLHSELNLRKQLAVQCKDLGNAKKQVVQDIQSKIERLNSFAPSLLTLIKATKPLQEALQAPFDRDWQIGRLVQLLPQPLYLAYMNIHALQLVYEADVNVVIIGTEKDVHEDELYNNDFRIEKVKDDFRESSRSSNRRTINGARDYVDEDNENEQQRKQLLKPHPLVVQFAIGNKANERECFFVNLKYLPRLGLITASSTVRLEELDGEMLASTHDVLKTLYDNDFGDVLPVPKTEYELKKIGMTPQEFLKHLSAHDLGKPYFWAHRICCIDTFNEHVSATETMQKIKIQDEITNVIKRMQEVWYSRLNLMKQIKALVQKNIDFYLKDEKLPTNRPSCSLVQWTSLSWEEYVGDSSTSPYIETGLSTANQLFYRAVVVRGSAKMECLISVSSKFPSESPLWIISVHWNGEHNATNSSTIKQMEFITNSLTQGQLNNSLALLSYQLFHTMFSFDVFLETEGPDEYPKEKNYIKAFAKRSRSRPFSPNLLYLLN